MNDLVLVDIVGGLRHADFHPYKGVLVYDAGSMVILWDLATDAKTNLIEHEADIACIKFAEDGRHLYTIDAGYTPSISYWTWANAGLVQHVYLPQKTRKFPIRDCRAIDSKTTNVLTVIENEHDGYRVSCWDTAKGELNFLFVADLDSDSYCQALYFTSSGNTFATAEASSIKVWNVNSSGVRQEQRIHLPQPLADSTVCALSRSFVVLTSSGKIVMLSGEVWISASEW